MTTATAPRDDIVAGCAPAAIGDHALPRAISHVGLVDAALVLAEAGSRAGAAA